MLELYGQQYERSGGHDQWYAREGKVTLGWGPTLQYLLSQFYPLQGTGAFYPGDFLYLACHSYFTHACLIAHYIIIRYVDTFFLWGHVHIVPFLGLVSTQDHWQVHF